MPYKYYVDDIPKQYLVGVATENEFRRQCMLLESEAALLQWGLEGTQSIDGLIETVNSADKFHPDVKMEVVSRLVGQRAEGGDDLDDLALHHYSDFYGYYRYKRAGKNIFHFQKSLTESLIHTDPLADFSITELIEQTPYDAFYLAYDGIDDEIQNSHGQSCQFQGFLFFVVWCPSYFSDTSESYIMGLCPIAPLRNYQQITFSDPAYRVGIEGDDEYVALQNPETGRMYPLWLDRVSKRTCFVWGFRDKAGKVGEVLGLLVDRFNKLSDKLGDRLASLLVNSLFYLSSEGRDVKYKYPDDIPLTLKNSLHQGKKKQREKAEAVLKKRGYSKIHFCGYQMQKEYERLYAETGREVNPHWRRGHWRNQACGPRMKEHKLVWIKPMIVRRDKGEPEYGHIYHVGDTMQP